jgi:hypothetical protein
MLYLIIALFAITAVFGLSILIRWFQKSDASKTSIYLHGIFAAISLVLLIVFAYQNQDNYPKISIILFVIAAMLGFYMFARDLMKKFSPMSVAIIHALVAVCGFVGLLIFVLV